ncbi:MAG: hypothetical protein OES09_15315 [Gammaproteobacteria bacterium]|nr:hypothetical protein [Gammaproteobacteria bacterium]
MSIFLQDNEAADIVGDAAIFALTPTNDPMLSAWQAERFKRFDVVQRGVILKFLEHAREFNADDYAGFDLEAAIEYWKGGA